MLLQLQVAGISSGSVGCSDNSVCSDICSAGAWQYHRWTCRSFHHLCTTGNRCLLWTDLVHSTLAPFDCCSPPLHLTTSKVMVIVWWLRGNIIRTVLYIANVLPLQWTQFTETVHTARLGLEFVLLYFLVWMIYLYVCVCFVLPWTVESFPFMFWHWCNKLKWAPFEFFAASPLLRVRSLIHPFKGHCKQKSMWDDGVIYVAGHPLLSGRCTRLPGCFHLPSVPKIF